MTASVLALSLCFLSIASLFSLVQAVPLTQHPDDITLKQGIIDELFVTDAWVIEDGGIYKMWYTHSRSDMDINGMASTLTSILTSEILDSLIGLDLEGLLTELAAIGDDSEKMDDLWAALLETTTIIGYATSADGIDWDVQNDNVLEGSPSEWENVGMPCIINDSGTYKMWFTHSETTLDKAGLQAILQNLGNGDMGVVRDALIDLVNSTSTAIGYTTSADSGASWAAPDYGVLGGGDVSIWESVAAPCVIEDSGTYKMWFTSAETSLISDDIDAILADIENFGIDDLLTVLDNTGSVISYTTSTDGISWAAPTVQMGSGDLWGSVATPCVIKNSDTDYEMWYTNVTTDLDATTLGDLFDELQDLEPDIQSLWTSFESGDLNAFLANLETFLGNPTAEPPVPGTFDDAKALLENTGTQIGYATSSDGSVWTEVNPAAISGYGGPWGSVYAPCVIIDGGVYKMWYTKGLEELTAQNIISMLDGTNLPIGYATSGESIELVAGWNFIGLPLNPGSSAIEDVLADIIDDVEIVWYYDGATTTWYYFIPDGPQNLTEMTDGKGYWIETTNPRTLIINGTEPLLPYDIQLTAGWNLISLPETPSNSTIEVVLADIIDYVEIVWYYDGSTTTWYYFIPDGPQNLTEMTEGKAYWIEMTDANTLTVN